MVVAGWVIETGVGKGLVEGLLAGITRLLAGFFAGLATVLSGSCSFGFATGLDFGGPETKVDLEAAAFAAGFGGSGFFGAGVAGFAASGFGAG